MVEALVNYSVEGVEAPLSTFGSPSFFSSWLSQQKVLKSDDRLCTVEIMGLKIKC